MSIEDSTSNSQPNYECGHTSQVVLPWANVGRLMKVSLPAGTKISKPAQKCVQSCASEFISFVTGESSDLCLQKGRKVINGDDIISALKSLGFDNYIRPLQIYLERYRDARKWRKDGDREEEEESEFIPYHRSDTDLHDAHLPDQHSFNMPLDMDELDPVAFPHHQDPSNYLP